jgi:hypothetical protein
MSALQTVNLKATVTGATFANGPALADDDKESLNQKIQAFVNTPEFQKSFKELGLNATQKNQVQLVFDGNTIKLRKKDNVAKEAVIEHESLSPIKETAELVKKMAEHYSKQSSLQPQSVNPPSLQPQSVNPPSLKPQSLKSTPLKATTPNTLGTKECATHQVADREIKSTYGVQGITNSGNGCFAASAYQIIANVPSLQSLRMEGFPQNSDAFLKQSKHSTNLKNYANGDQHSPQDVFRAIINSDEANQVIHTTVVEDFNTRTKIDENLKREMIEKIIENEERSYDSSSILYCPTDETASTFSSQMHSALNTIYDRTDDSSEEINVSLERRTEPNVYDKYPYTARLKTTKRYTKTPPTLIIQLSQNTSVSNPGNIPLNQKIKTPITDIPLILHLNDYGALTQDDKKPLELKGFTVHKGVSGNSGHYISYFQKENPSKPGEYQWFCANDSKIFTVTKEGALDALSYADTLYYDDQVTSTEKPFISYTQLLKSSSSIVSDTSNVNPVSPSTSLTTSSSVFQETSTSLDSTNASLRNSSGLDSSSSSQSTSGFQTLLASPVASRRPSLSESVSPTTAIPAPSIWKRLIRVFSPSSICTTFSNDISPTSV